MQQSPPDAVDPESAAAAEPIDDAPTVEVDRRWTRIRRALLIATIVPIYIAAIRDGLGGWYPALDAATVASRARDVFSAHPPLVGMWASVSADLGRPTYFPGAIQLYLMAIPIRVLGPAWGTLLTMATINAVSVLGAGWLATRRLGPRVATIAYLGLALMVWTMGSEILIDAAPMQMITLPFALFVFAVWSVADGDLPAIPILAAIASYLVLDHLALTLLVPVIGGCAVIGLVVHVLRHRADSDGWPAYRSRLFRMLGLGIALTVLLWIPSLIQQLQNSPGNLTNLWNAKSISEHNHNTLSQALDATTSILAKPPFWLGNSFRYPGFGMQGIDTLDTVILIVLVVAYIGLVLVAYRRHDHTSLAALGIAGVATVASVYNITRAPSPYGFRVQYLHSLWVVAMFVWVAVATTIIRNVPPLTTRVAVRRIAGFGAAATLLVAAFTLPHRGAGTVTNGTSDHTTALFKQVRGPAVEGLQGKGQVMLAASGTFSTYAIWAGMILALESNGIDVCVAPIFVEQYGVNRACKPGGPDVFVSVTTAAFPAAPYQKVVAEGTTMSKAEQAEYQRLAGKVAGWLSTQKKLEVSPEIHTTIVKALPEKDAKIIENRVVDTGGLGLGILALSQSFADFVATRSIRKPDGTVIAAFKTPGLSPEDLVRWAELAHDANAFGTIRISIEPLPPGT